MVRGGESPSNRLCPMTKPLSDAGGIIEVGRREGVKIPSIQAVVGTSSLMKQETSISSKVITYWPFIIYALVTIMWGGWLYSLTSWRFDNFMPGVDDILYTENALWSSLRGRLLGQSFLTVPYLGTHFSPALLLWLPSYSLHPSPYTVAVLHAVTMAIGAWPIWLLARRELGEEWISLIVGLTVLCTPYALLTALDSPYPDAIGYAAMGFLLYGLQSRRAIITWLALAVTLLFREDYGLAVAGVGLYLISQQGRRRLGLVLLVGGCLWSAVLIGVVMPPIGGGPYTHGGINPRLGDGPASILMGALRDPALAFREMTASPRPDYLLWLLLPFSFVPLLAPSRLLAGLPLVARNLLTAAPNRSMLVTHYSAGIVPAVAFAFVGGLARLPHQC